MRVHGLLWRGASDCRPNARHPGAAEEPSSLDAEPHCARQMGGLDAWTSRGQLAFLLFVWAGDPWGTPFKINLREEDCFVLHQSEFGDMLYLSDRKERKRNVCKRVEENGHAT